MPDPRKESVTGVLVRGRFVDGRFVEDGAPPEPTAPAVASDPQAELGAYLRDAAVLLERAGAASHAYLQAWTALLERGGTRR
jgi:hypothetical protein